MKRALIESAVVNSVAEGLSTDQIAARVGCSDTTVRKIRKAHGISAPTGRIETKACIEKACLQCGRSFSTKREAQVFCVNRCKLAAMHEVKFKLPVDATARLALLVRLYWTENRTSPEIAALLGMTHRGILDAMRKLGIKRRHVGKRPDSCCIEDGCTLPVFKVKHRTNGSMYGRRCRLHWIIFRMEVNQRYNDKHLGKDDEAWLRRMRQALARVQRLNREVSQSLNAGSKPETTSPAACPL